MVPAAEDGNESDGLAEGPGIADHETPRIEDLVFLEQTQRAIPRLLLAELPSNERRILSGRFGLAGSPFALVGDVARELGMTCEAVSLGTDRLLRQLRDRLEEHGWTADLLR